jgi:hypothetical protein
MGTTRMEGTVAFDVEGVAELLIVKPKKITK